MTTQTEQRATSVLAVNDADFASRVLQSESPVLVDFWAEWCGPCHTLGPVIEQVAAEYDGRVTVAKVNVEESQQTAQAYGIASIPTVLIFHKGKVVNTFVGVQPPQVYRTALDAAIGNN